MITLVYTLTDETFNLIKSKYGEFIEKNPSQYVIFFAKKKGIVINVYNTLKAVIRVIENSDDHLEIVRILSCQDVPFFAAMGSDEVGTGALFGPITVCACYVDEKINEKIKSLKVKDSKALSDKDILVIAPKLIEFVPYSLFALDNEKFNEMTARGYNMNKLKAILHNQAYLNLSKSLGFSPKAVMDQFCEPQTYYNYFSFSDTVYKDVIFKTKAESFHIAVACASIIARYSFLDYMRKISEKVGFVINNGAGADADADLQRIYCAFGYDFLPKITKMNFKNLRKIEK